MWKNNPFFPKKKSWTILLFLKSDPQHTVLSTATLGPNFLKNESSSVLILNLPGTKIRKADYCGNCYGRMPVMNNEQPLSEGCTDYYTSLIYCQILFPFYFLFMDSSNSFIQSPSGMTLVWRMSLISRRNRFSDPLKVPVLSG